MSSPNGIRLPLAYGLANVLESFYLARAAGIPLPFPHHHSVFPQARGCTETQTQQCLNTSQHHDFDHRSIIVSNNCLSNTKLGQKQVPVSSLLDSSPGCHCHSFWCVCSTSPACHPVRLSFPPAFAPERQTQHQ